ncbi:class F sortase [Streptomyces sp. NPDC052043]|uniref:class F sortase n=1 Tax=Streptomyces sp. NPDC052043 TaxID=3365684 RepID=UPI0037D7720B
MKEQPAPPAGDSAQGAACHGGIRGWRWILCFGLAVLLLGVLMIQRELATAYNAPVSAGPLPLGARSGSASAAPRRPGLAYSPPVRLRIPQIQVDAPFTQLGLDDSGAVSTPPASTPNLVGWYRGSVAPGQDGTSVVVGHLDTRTGPAVFQRLSTLRPGALINVTRADGSTAVFRVTAVRTYAKDRFPDQEVYGDTPGPQLRLITCGGSYDRDRREYDYNVVAFARLESWPGPAPSTAAGRGEGRPISHEGPAGRS